MTKNTQTETADASQNRAQYVCVSIPAWREQAAHAIAQGQSEIDFLANCHPDNRSNARTAYRIEKAAWKRDSTGNFVFPGDLRYATGR